MGTYHDALKSWLTRITTDEHIHENTVQNPAIVEPAEHYKQNSPGDSNIIFTDAPETLFGLRVRTRREYSCDESEDMKYECQRLMEEGAVVECASKQHYRSVNTLWTSIRHYCLIIL